MWLKHYLRANRFQFYVGIFTGLMTSLLFLRYRDYVRLNYSKNNLATDVLNASAKIRELTKIHEASPMTDDYNTERNDRIRGDNKWNNGILKRRDFDDDSVHHDDDSVAKKLEKRVRVLCWVMTSPKNLNVKASIVKETWGKRCNKLLFFSSVANTSFPAVGLNVSEGRQHLTAKTVKAFQYIYEHHLNDADWFMKADDDTYVIVENLRYFLSTKNTSDPVYYGLHFKPAPYGTYHSGGAGYVLSKEALVRFGRHGSNSSICSQDGNIEDYRFGQCLAKLGVTAAKSSDSLGRTRFNCFLPTEYIADKLPSWYRRYREYNVVKGIEGLSDYSVSFHQVSPMNMYILEYYIYHLRPYGIISHSQELN